METFFIPNVSYQLFLDDLGNELIINPKKETFFVSGVSGGKCLPSGFPLFPVYEFT
ncbi:MAG: hypothetical protein JWO09_1720 [Bacteroidetes bacterium]|nr:hypothetical protein [Bacteroidota bacterium]